MSQKFGPYELSIMKGKQPHSNIVSVPAALSQEWKKRNTTHIRVGSLVQRIVFVSNDSQDRIRLTPTLLRYLGLHKGMYCYSSFSPSHKQTAQLGPVLGVYVGGSYIHKLLAQKPKERTMNLVKANDDVHNILYFFSARDIKSKQKQVIGTYYNPTNSRWERGKFPFPDVLYERGESAVGAHLAAKQGNKMRGFQKINARHHFSKWDLHRKLGRYASMRRYLPATKLYRQDSDVRHMIQRYGQVYVKKIGGSNGRSIMLIEKQDNGQFRCTTYTDKVVSYQRQSFAQVMRIIHARYTPSKTILQERIDLLRKDQHNIDFRATLQRDGQGKLGITAIAARVGEKGSPVTSTRTGSTCYRFKDFLINHLGYSESEQISLLNRVTSFLQQVYQAVEKAYGRFGELGIDFAIDQKGNLMLIECNAKPAKSALAQSYDTDTVRQSFRAPLKYAQYISGF